MGPGLVSINQAAALVGVSRRTIYLWLAAEKLRYVRTAGGRVRIVVDSLIRPGVPRPEAAPARPTCGGPTCARSAADIRAHTAQIATARHTP